MQFNEQAFIRLYQQASIKTIESSNFYIGVSLGVIPNYSKAFIFGKKQGMSAAKKLASATIEQIFSKYGTNVKAEILNEYKDKRFRKTKNFQFLPNWICFCESKIIGPS